MLCCPFATGANAADPFAVAVVAYDPAPGQFVNVSIFNDPTKALGPPNGAGTDSGDESVVTLGGFGGSITLGFDHRIEDDPLNAFGMDAIVFGNAFWSSRTGTPDPNRHFSEAAMIEICLDGNGNGRPDADEPWYLIPGSHIPNPTAQFLVVTWDDNVDDATYPPALASWIPPGFAGMWTTQAFELPAELFGSVVVRNPSLDLSVEGIFGYAEYSPTLIRGDLDADNVAEVPTIAPEDFYTVPDDPFTVGITPGSGGGDAFDIARAIDPKTGLPAGIRAFDFIRITAAVDAVSPTFGEKSPEIDAVADVAPDPFGDLDDDGDIDLLDAAELQVCFGSSVAPADACGRADRQPDGVIGDPDVPAFALRMTGPLERGR